MIFIRYNDILLLEFLRNASDDNCIIIADSTLHRRYKDTYLPGQELSIEQWEHSIQTLTIYGLLTQIKEMTFSTNDLFSN